MDKSGCNSNDPSMELVSGLFQSIDRVARRLRHIEKQVVKESGLTPTQIHLLRMLCKQDLKPLKDLAQEAGISRAAVTGIVDALVADGLVTREPNPDDRRSLLARLSRKGKDLLRKVPDTDRIFGSCCVGLTESEFRRLRKLIEKLELSLSC